MRRVQAVIAVDLLLLTSADVHNLVELVYGGTRRRLILVDSLAQPVPVI